MRYSRIQEIRDFSKGGRAEEAPAVEETESQSYEDWVANG